MSIILEILTASQYEHFKAAKELATLYPLDHPKRVQIERELNEITRQIQTIKSETK
jgi:uncharacterized protein involved in exopolysaccharide biosynthesis